MLAVNCICLTRCLCPCVDRLLNLPAVRAKAQQLGIVLPNHVPATVAPPAHEAAAPVAQRYSSGEAFIPVLMRMVRLSLPLLACQGLCCSVQQEVLDLQ